MLEGLFPLALLKESLTQLSNTAQLRITYVAHIFHEISLLEAEATE
jgi:hypothetical protein